MAYHRGHASEEQPSEERTEPFSQSEVDARMKSIRVEEPIDEEYYGAVPLSRLKVEDHHHKQGIRILVRPLTRSRSVSPGNGSCQWLALRAEVASQEAPEHKVLAVTQTSKDIKFSVRIPSECLEDDTPRPPLWCELYYDPASDNQILLNRSEVPISLTRLSDDPEGEPSAPFEIKPIMTKALSPGSWRIIVEDISVLDFRVLHKLPSMFVYSSSSVSEEDVSESDADTINSSGKRERKSERPDLICEKRARASDASSGATSGDGVIMFLRSAAEPLVFPLPTGNKSKALVPTSGHALLDVRKDETVAIPDGCEIDEYTVTKRDQIASTALSSVYTAEHSNVPNGIVTVKVLKTRSTNPAIVQKPHEVERNVIRQADMWLREYQSQDDLKHESIVRLYGGDARFLSLYMEHVDARDLSSRGVWRSPRDDNFTGGRDDALRILRDVTSALHYLHSRKLVHNDIKPGNILYSPERGAVLCDFGLSTLAGGPATTGGTPFYVPPEFVGAKQRGPASDVWALGVTMLYILRKLPFPDARGGKAHPKQLYWQIADLNRPAGLRSRIGPSGTRIMSAVEQMQTWLSEVRDVADRLDPRDALEKLVIEMLIPNTFQRATTLRLMRELFAEQQGALLVAR